MHTTYPPDWVSGADAEAMLSGARDSAVAKVDGTSLSERCSSLQTFPGGELCVEAIVEGQIGLVQVRMNLAGNRLF